MKRRLLILIIFIGLIVNIIQAEEIKGIKFADDIQEFAIFNKNNGKIFKYKILHPTQKIQFITDNIDSLIIYTRIRSDTLKKVEYSYSLSINKKLKKIINKSTEKSTVSKCLNGKPVSKYNKYICYLNNRNVISMNNLSPYDMLIKLDHAYRETKKQLKYVSLSPQRYGVKRKLIINDKEYLYFSTDPDPIELNITGSFLLKIISRIVYTNQLAENYSYRFNIYDKGELLTEIREVAQKSSKALFAQDKKEIPSTGDVNILEFDEGEHKIKINNPDKNRQVIFRLYINKLTP